MNIEEIKKELGILEETRKERIFYQKDETFRSRLNFLDIFRLLSKESGNYQNNSTGVLSSVINEILTNHEKVRLGNSYAIESCKYDISVFEDLAEVYKNQIAIEIVRMFLERHPEYYSDDIKKSDYYT